MFPSLFQHDPDTLDIRLAVSRDGINWTRPQQDRPYIPLGKPGAFDSGSLYMGQGMIRAGDELWLYYSGSPLKHEEGSLEKLKDRRNARVYSRVVTKLDRFVCVEAGAKAGSFTTPPLIYTGNTLKLNVSVAKGGSVRVGLLDKRGRAVPCRAVDDCLPITGDHISKLVRWKAKNRGSAILRAGRPTRLQVRMKNARLYAFQFAAASAR